MYKLNAMSKTNTLNSHHGESNSSRADKMSGWIKRFKKSHEKNCSMKDAKVISNRKRRMFLKHELNWEKI